MNRKELLKLAEKSRIENELYDRNGIDDTAKLFLHSLKRNEYHQNRKRIFENYTGYEQRY